MVDKLELDPQNVAELVTSIRDVRYTQLVSFVVATIVIYDYVVCLEREVELIWKKRWSVIKLAFLWHRYLGVFCVLFQAYALNAPTINDEFCTFWFFWETWGYCAVLFTSEAVLLLWMHVVYNKNRWILAILSTFYTAEIAGVITILTISFEGFQAHAHGIPGFEYCVMTDIGGPFQLLWVPILGFDVLLLLLFLYRGCAGACPKSSWRWAYSYDGLLDMIYRHSLLNFLAIFASYLACAIIWLMFDLGLYQIPVSFALALSITNCTRLLLNIRRAYYMGVSDPILFNIREMARNDTPLPGPSSLDVPISPTSPASPFSELSGPTLREKTISPTSTLRFHNVSPTSTVRVTTSCDRGETGSKVGTPPASLSKATPSSPLRLGSPFTEEYMRAREVYLSRVDPDWWQCELRDMRPTPRISFGEAV